MYEKHHSCKNIPNNDVLASYKTSQTYLHKEIMFNNNILIN